MPRASRGSPVPRPNVRTAALGVSRRGFLGLLGVGVLGALGGVGVASAYRFRVESIAAALPGLRDPVRVAWLADMHYGPFMGVGSVDAWVDATLDLRPDLILLGGDLVDHSAPADVTPLVERLARLRAPLGVFAVWGNHDHCCLGGRAGLVRLAADLARVGITVLVNRGVQLPGGLYLAGIDDYGTGEPDLARALADRPADGACLLASHQPDALPRVPATVDLTLCGHTHGGQVRLPGIGAVLTRTRLGRAYEAGWVRAPALGYVSRGLGVVHLPIRFNCPAELTLATLTPG